ncbi:DUF1963 domain-containing protein [Agrobacterium sp. BA1120]|uniref:DUF1963 domain-containing protein n=1 Tax=Agrobacterium sp. BA1120 TaxID=3228927 RepID=UPI003369C92F
MRLKTIPVLLLSAIVSVFPVNGGFAQMTETIQLPQSRDDLTSRLKQAGISVAGTKSIVTLARDAQVLDTTSEDESRIPIGASKFGGRPDLPDTMPWPVRPAYEDGMEMARELETDAANLYADAGLVPPWMGKEGQAFLEARKRFNKEVNAGTLALFKEADVDLKGVDLDKIFQRSSEGVKEAADELRAKADAVAEPFPLTFIAQIDLEVMAQKRGFASDLPRKGRLLFFYDLPQIPAGFKPQSRVGWQIIYDETPREKLKRVDVPSVLMDFPAVAALYPMSVTSRAIVSTIPIASTSWDVLQPASGHDEQTYHEWLYSLGWPTEEGGGNHQLGGWPRAIQSSMQSQSQLASNGIYAGTSDAYDTDAAKALLTHADDWQLVLQIGSDKAAGNDLPGAIYVLMKKDDLKNRHFEKAWVVYEQD